MKFSVITTIPEMFPGYLEHSIVGRALKQNLWSLEIIDLHEYTTSKIQRVDDTIFGGGAGMLIRPDILSSALDKIGGDIICYPSPSGQFLNQKILSNYVSKYTHIIIICGRYEGIDSRILEYYNINEISLGNFVITGGEIAAYALIDGCVRLLQNAISSHSTEEESFATSTEYENLIEYPQYTRPAIWRNIEVPEILKTGHHANIAKWRLEQAKIRTKNRNNEK